MKKLDGGRCRRCGLDNFLLLEFNHLNGNPKHRTGDNAVRDILSGLLTKKDIEVLCSNCHVLYAFENGQRVNWDKKLVYNCQ